MLRTLGHGDSVAVVQFIKGGWQPGEAKALEIILRGLTFTGQEALGIGLVLAVVMLLPSVCVVCVRVPVLHRAH